MLTQILIAVVAFLHLCFLVLEMFLWTKPTGLRIFRQSLNNATLSKSLAMNMGLYNGFLAAGLIWSLYLGAEGQAMSIFFLSCIIIAGIFAAFTASRVILYVQALPAAIALASIFL